MRIDIITDTFAPDINGVAMTLGRLSQGLIRSGHRVTVICSGEQPTSSTTIAAIPLPGYKEVRIGLPGPFKLRKRWMKKRPDVIYVATESPLGVSAVSVACGLGIPVTTGFHTNFHEYMEQYKLKALQPAAMSYLRHIHRRAHATMAPSREVIDMLRREGIEHAHLLGRGVDTQLFSPVRRDPALRATWGADSESLVYLIVGRVAAEKNIPLAMRALRNCMPPNHRRILWSWVMVLCERVGRKLNHGCTLPECSAMRTWHATTHRRMYCFFPARRKHSATSCWKAWPAVLR